MGNTDSHSSFSSSAKSSCSVTFSSRQEEVQSAHSWWSSRRGRSHPKQQAADSPYSSWHHELPPRGAGSPQRYVSGERRQSGGSPKVLLSKDGSMRVEFTNTRVIPMEPLDLPGIPASSTSAAPEPSLRTSKGSSLSSVGSWYDSPWGAGGETTDSVFVCRQSAANSGGYTTHSPARTEGTTTTIGSSDYNAFFSAKVDVSPGFNSRLLFSSAETGGYNSCSSGRTEDSGIGDSVILQPDLRDFSLVSASTPSLDVYSTYSTLPAFPTPPDATLQQRGTSTCSSKGLLDDVFQEEGSAGGVEQLYSSFTLPRRWTEPASSTSTSTSTSGNNRKDFLKSRIRRLSDWTGSLSRKKRKIQEPSSSEDVFSLDSVWTSNPLNQLPAAPSSSSSSSSSALNLSSDLQRRNVYDTFMQELETGCNRTEPSEEEEEEEETDGEMEVLYEKEKGVVRRAGWLSFKPLLTVNKDRKLELVARRKWRRYWVTLKGCSLLLYETYGRTRSSEQEPAPRLAVVADDSVVQPVPEHPRRENVFCLSNSQGDVYLLQATNQTDLENWVTAIHSASASLLAKRQGKEDTLHLLRCQSRSLLHDIDLDAKMKKMAELQLSVIKEQKNRRAVENQIQQWEQNLEKLNLVLFRLRCYQSSLQGSELPNPKSLLAVASRPSKSMLGRLGVFSVSSFHALVCSRDETTLRRRTLAGGHRRGRGLSPTLKTLDRLNRRSRNDGPTTTQRLDCSSNHREVPPPAGRPAALQLQPSVLAVFTLNICRDGATEDFGFSVTGHVDGGGRSHVYVSEVDPLGVSAREGLTAGDEVLSVNGATMSGLDLDLMQNVFSHQNLQLLLRRDESLGLDGPFAAVVRPDPSDPYQVPPPSDLQTWTSSIHKDSSPLRDAPVPACDVVSLKSSEDGEQKNQNAERVYSLYQTFPECRAVDVDVPRNPYCKEAGLQPPSPAHLSVCQRLRKVIQELVDTEKSYVKDLVCLFHVYLTPLQTETFLSQEEMEALFGSLPEMLDFQRVFLQTLEERIASCPNFGALETPGQFQTLLFSLGGSFLHYADHFKHYSGFCANHLKVQKVLERAKVDGAFKLFLEARNPTNQHSSSLESYLIKPVQRVLKYPLLLRELVSLTDPESPEHTHLTEALRAMEKVASHINEMQKIYEEFGSVFDQLVAEQSGPHRQVTEISMGEFLVHSSVLWLNPLPSLGRLRRDPELTLFVFKRAVVLVYRQSAKLKKRMTASRSADLDPFRFRWLIPVSAVQVRPANITGPENPCVWDLVHSRSEVEGRPETVFQLCSSGLETKVSVLRVLRSVLRDRPPAGSLRRTRPSTAERRRQRCRSDSQRMGRHRSGQNRRPDGSFILGETSSEPLLPSAADSTAKRTRLCSLTSELEAQLQRLNVTEERAGPGTAAAAKRRSPAGDEFDLLERDFSVQSVTSMINEECFYDSQMAKANVLTAENRQEQKRTGTGLKPKPRETKEFCGPDRAARETERNADMTDECRRVSG